MTAMAGPALAGTDVPQSPALPGRLPFQLLQAAIPAADLVVILLLSVLSGAAYGALFLSDVAGFQTFAVGVLVFANFSALTSAQNNYRVNSLVNLGRQIRYVTITWWFICLMLVGVAFTLKISDNFSRGATLSFFVIGWFGLICFRALLSRSLKHALENRGFAERKIVLITELEQQDSSRALRELRKCGYSATKVCEISAAEIDAPGIKTSLQKKIDDIVAVSQQESIDHIFLLIKWNRRQFIEQITRALRVLPLSIHLLPDNSVSSFLANGMANVGTTWTVELQRTPLSAIEQLYKRAFDICGAAVAVVMLAPLLLATAIAIKIDSKGPVLFKQRRNGFNGRTFTIFKFRTMHVLEDGDFVAQATSNDPRATRLGRLLRRTSIDELPQLFNVLGGNMSLVGPRPHAVAHNYEYKNIVANYAYRHHVKPGITGWAQINGYRGETRTVDRMEQRVECDLWYINHWSPWLDMRILLNTMVKAYRQPNAY